MALKSTAEPLGWTTALLFKGEKNEPLHPGAVGKSFASRILDFACLVSVLAVSDVGDDSFYAGMGSILVMYRILSNKIIFLKKVNC